MYYHSIPEVYWAIPSRSSTRSSHAPTAGNKSTALLLVRHLLDLATAVPGSTALEMATAVRVPRYGYLRIRVRVRLPLDPRVGG